MSKFIYVNNEINEGMFVILQTIEALECKYCGGIPKDIEKEMATFKKHLIDRLEGKDKYPDVDFEDVKLIHQYIYNKDEIEKNENNTNKVQ